MRLSQLIRDSSPNVFLLSCVKLIHSFNATTRVEKEAQLPSLKCSRTFGKPTDADDFEQQANFGEWRVTEAPIQS